MRETTARRGTGFALIAASASLLAACDDGAEAGEADGDVATEVSLPAGLEREELETVIREYILANPEIIPEAMDRLQQRQMGQNVSLVRDQLETPFEGGWAGSANPDVTIVEFFDYACGYCRQSLPDIERLLREDDSIRIVFRELPILSPESEAAARVSLSAARQNEYFDFHRAMYRAGRPSDAAIAEARQAAGLNAEQVQSDIADAAITAELQNNIQLAGQLGLSGTPVFVVGDQVLAGAVGYDRLKAAVEEARASES